MTFLKTRLSALIFGLFGMVALTGCTSLVGGTTIDTGPTKTEYVLSGTTGPTIVLEAGLGDHMGAWEGIYAQTSQFASTFAYSRPGYGQSSANDFPPDRDGKRTATEMAPYLKNLLAKAGAKPPYILVAHSIGSNFALQFAATYPQEVAGLVMVDGRPPNFTTACDQAKAGMCRPPELMLATMPSHMAAEVRGARLFEANPPAMAGIANIPATFLVATQPDFLASAQFQSLWRQEQAQWANQFAKAERIEVNSTHYIHHKKPDIVMDAIRAMVKKVQ
ncbi:alpha/beta fold hydrolase [Maritalea myrionectae]|uniref:alpha/beta fold hydrolase n=1 Tax=Maritalea myrionectae TaxID=454601 RepID=UPI00041EA4B7|nr:alpha/beta hydrolase [Maritalea myrionectae]